MATTTNYGWTTPDDTNLVKNGASDIRTLANAIDSTVKTNADAAVGKTIVDAKGDLIVATGNDAVSRLAVGANNTFLMADSAEATGLKWGTPQSGSYTLIQTITISNGATTLTASSIPQTYRKLEIWHNNVYSNSGTTTVSLYTRPNNDTSGSNYYSVRNPVSAYSWDMNGTQPRAAWVEEFWNYASTSEGKPYRAFGFTSTSSGYQQNSITNGYASASAITSITWTLSSSTLAGGTIRIYGVN